MHTSIHMHVYMYKCVVCLSKKGEKKLTPPPERHAPHA